MRCRAGQAGGLLAFAAIAWLPTTAGSVAPAGPAVARPAARLVSGRPHPVSRIGEPDERNYQPPVTAPVTDPFRPPPEPWMAGNRGIEYTTAPGTSVGAIGPGVVSFAGPVAGSLYVTVTHPDGLRSSYSFLATIRTSVGEHVTTGQTVGVAAARFHVGVRRGDTYLDPASLWGRRVAGGRVALVPLDAKGSGVEPRGRVPRPGRAGTDPRVAPGARAGSFGETVGAAAAGVAEEIADALGPLIVE